MIHNVHRRELAAPPDEVWTLIESLGSADNRIWPPGWPAIHFDPDLAVGARGRHGPVHYRVETFDRVSGLVLEFLPPTGIEGFHAFHVLPGDDEHVVLEHEIQGSPRGRMRLVWPLAMRWLHDTVLEELLDQAERALGHEPEHPHRRNAWVRFIVRLTSQTVRAIQPEDAKASGLPRVDWSDAYEITLPHGAPRDPDYWRQAIFAGPASRQWLLGARDHAGRLVGLKPAHNNGEPSRMFDVRAVMPDAVVLGGDDRHLDFRVVVAVTDDIPARLALTTAVQFHNVWGRRYLRVVAPFHRRIVPHIMRRAVADA